MNAAANHPKPIRQPSETGSKVAIVTDSIAQVPVDLAEQLGITVVPFSVVVEERTYTDLTDLNLNELYRRMRQEKDLHLVTSAPSVGIYYDIFKHCFLTGVESILYLAISSRLSHAYSSATQAASMLREEGESRPILLYDTCLATMAQGFLTIEAARLARQDLPPQEILRRVEAERKHTGFAAGLETLEYLARGGRIGKAAYMLGSAIRILPVVSLNSRGEVLPVSRKLGYSNVMEEIVRYVKKQVAGCRSLSLAVMHADVPQWAEKLRNQAVEQFHPDEMFTTDFTPTMVAHTGPGIIGLAYHWKE